MSAYSSSWTIWHVLFKLSQEIWQFPLVKPLSLLWKKNRERENWHAAWRLLVLRRLSLSGKEKGSAIYLSPSTGCLMTWPDVFVKVCNTWTKSSGCCNGSIIQTLPRLFSLLFALQPHTYFQDGLEAPVFRESDRHRVVTVAAWDPNRPLCHPSTTKSQPHSEVWPLIAAHVEEICCMWRKKGLKEQFLYSAFSWFPFSSTKLYTCIKCFFEGILILHFERYIFSHQKHFVHPQNVRFPRVWEE